MFLYIQNIREQMALPYALVPNQSSFWLDLTATQTGGHTPLGPSCLLFSRRSYWTIWIFVTLCKKNQYLSGLLSNTKYWAIASPTKRLGKRCGRRKDHIFLVDCPSKWSLYLALALCVDHISIIPTERQVQRCTLAKAFPRSFRIVGNLPRLNLSWGSGKGY